MASKKGKPSKKAAKKTTVTELALESGADAISCGSCVIETIQSHCDRAVGSLDDKLRDVCAPCDPGVMADLADELIATCGAPSDLTLTCSLTVRQVIKRVCE